MGSQIWHTSYLLLESSPESSGFPVAEESFVFVFATLFFVAGVALSSAN